MAKTFLLALVLLSGGLTMTTMTACSHTAHGIERDADRAGDKMERAADRAGDKIHDATH